MRRPRYLQTKRHPRIFVPAPGKRQIVIPLPGISLLLVFGLSLLSLFLAFRSDLFLIHEILVEVKAQNQVLSLVTNEIKLATDLTKSQTLGRSIFFIDSQKIIAEIEKNFLTIKEVSLRKSYPNQLSLILTPRAPVAEITTWPASAAARLIGTEAAELTSKWQERLKERLISDETGFLFAKIAAASGLPKIDIFLDRTIDLGERLEENRIQFALNLIADLKDRKIEVEEIGLVGWEAIPVRLGDQTLVIFSSKKSEAEQVAALQAILIRHRIENKYPKQVDLRYEKAVVRY